MEGKAYDRKYFDRWYRGKERVRGAADLARKAAFVLAAADHVLGRPARTVLDVGCGEGAWRAPLRRLRPSTWYLGIDASDYAVARFGRSRRILLSRFGDVGSLGLPCPFDVVVCSDVLHYVAPAEMTRGLAAIAPLVGGVAFLDLLAAEDGVTGDLHGWKRRPSRWYRERISATGLVELGLGLWAGQETAEGIGALLRSGARP